MNIQEMLKQAQQMQERLQQELAETQVEATAGGGMVTVVMNGQKQIKRITIDPEVVSTDDVEMTHSAGWMRPWLGRWGG